MARPTIFLYDIDGTLVSTGGAGTRAMGWAFGQVHGRHDACAGFSLGGMTDRAIIRRGLRTIEGGESEAAIDAVLESYLERLAVELAAAPDVRRLAGVDAALTLSAARPDSALGLGTGNVRRGARTKLAALDLWRRFDFGGFGCDSEDRGELLAAGATRGAARLGLARAQCRVIVIGDTPRDVLAARAIGARCLAVATGPYTLEELRSAQADWTVETLADPLALEVLAAG